MPGLALSVWMLLLIPCYCSLHARRSMSSDLLLTTRAPALSSRALRRWHEFEPYLTALLRRPDPGVMGHVLAPHPLLRVGGEAHPSVGPVLGPLRHRPGRHELQPYLAPRLRRLD